MKVKFLFTSRDHGSLFWYPSAQSVLVCLMQRLQTAPNEVLLTRSSVLGIIQLPLIPIVFRSLNRVSMVYLFSSLHVLVMYQKCYDSNSLTFANVVEKTKVWLARRWLNCFWFLVKMIWIAWLIEAKVSWCSSVPNLQSCLPWGQTAAHGWLWSRAVLIAEASAVHGHHHVLPGRARALYPPLKKNATCSALPPSGNRARPPRPTREFFIF